MIALERRNGRPLRIGHRGAAALAPENTLRSFRAAIEAGVDLIEFDVIEVADGSLVVAHAPGDVGPDTPTPRRGAAILRRRGAGDRPPSRPEADTSESGMSSERSAGSTSPGRSFVSSVLPRNGSCGRGDRRRTSRVGLTIPRRIFRISDQGRGAPLGRLALRTLRRVTPPLVRPLLAVTRAHDVVLHHSLVTRSSVRAAHARGAAVVTWTVDDPDDTRARRRGGSRRGGHERSSDIHVYTGNVKAAVRLFGALAARRVRPPRLRSRVRARREGGCGDRRACPGDGTSDVDPAPDGAAPDRASGRASGPGARSPSA